MVEATQMQFDKGRACTCDLLAEPYERTSTIVTSNLDFTVCLIALNHVFQEASE